MSLTGQTLCGCCWSPRSRAHEEDEPDVVSEEPDPPEESDFPEEESDFFSPESDLFSSEPDVRPPVPDVPESESLRDELDRSSEESVAFTAVAAVRDAEVVAGADEPSRLTRMPLVGS
jgi:hypothetical protein